MNKQFILDIVVTFWLVIALVEKHANLFTAIAGMLAIVWWVWKIYTRIISPQIKSLYDKIREKI